LRCTVSKSIEVPSFNLAVVGGFLTVSEDKDDIRREITESAKKLGGWGAFLLSGKVIGFSV
jgi:hypothetical protein